MLGISNEQTDFELEQYALELIHEVNSLAYAEDEGASKEEKFTEHIMEILAEAGETEGIRLCTYTKENKYENIDLKINGYAIEEGFESVDLFVSYFIDSPELFNVRKPEFDGLIKCSTKFLSSSLKGHLDDLEPSSEAHGLSTVIRKNREEIVRVNLFIVSNGNIGHDAPRSHKVKGFENIQINVNVWDLERLHRLNQSKYNREPITIDFDETLDVEIPCLAMPTTNKLYECYLAIVPGQALSILYKNYGTRLLESNVRAFLQQTGKVNKGIRDTIKHEPHMFLPFNNGLAATSMEAEVRTNDNGQLVLLSVKDFQIVNGGQTTASLFHTHKKHKADLSKVFVQMKLTVIRDEEKKNEIVPFISRYANSQNKVSELDLTSNNSFLIRLEELSRTTYAADPLDRNKQTIWFFERVKGQFREALNKEPTRSKQQAFKLKFPSHQKIIKSEVAKYMNIYHKLPFHVSKGAQKNYNQYLKDAETDFRRIKPSRAYWEDVVANAILFKTADRIFGRKNQDPIGDTNIKSHTVAYGLALMHYLMEGRLDLRSIWEDQLVDDRLQQEIRKSLIFVYNYFSSLNVLLISEAAKAEKTWLGLIDQKSIPLDMDVLKEFMISEKQLEQRAKEETSDVEEAKKYNDMQIITDCGLKFWDGLNIYNSRTNILSEYQGTFAGRIRKKLLAGHSLTDIEIRNGATIVRSIKVNVDFDRISALSKISDDKLINPSELYNKLSRLEDNTWSRIFDLGDQTGTLSFNEVSVLKTVRQKLKRKETIDVKRMAKAEESLHKMRKFGIKI